MSTNSLKVQGKVFLRATQQSLVGHVVNVVRGEGTNAVVVASGNTDPTGRFVVDLPLDLSRLLLASGGEALSFRVIDPCGKPVDDGASGARWTPASAGDCVSLGVGPAGVDPCCARTPDEAAVYVVRGAVAFDDGRPAPGIVVMARHRAIGEEVALGLAKSDDGGRFYIRYAPPMQGTTRLPVGLSLRLEQGDGAEVMTTGVIEDAPADIEVNLTLLGGKSSAPFELPALEAKVAPHLGAVALRTLSPKDIALLAARAGVDADRLHQLHLADTFHERASKHWPTPAEMPVPRGAFYVFLRVKGEERFVALTTAPRTEIAAALAEGAVERIVAPWSQEQREAFADALRTVGVRDSLTDPETSTPTPFGTVLGHALPSVADREAFTAFWYDRRTAPEQFWAELPSHEPFVSDPALLPKVRYALQLGVLTGYRLPVVDVLRARPEVTSLEALAALSWSEWRMALDMAHMAVDATAWLPTDLPGATTPQRLDAYARRLQQSLEASFPTQVLRAELGRAIPLALPDMALVKSFLDFSTNSAFNLTETQVELYLAQKGDAAFAEGTSAKDREDTLRGLQRVQRLYRVAPRADALRPLIEAGVQGAGDLVARGMPALVQMMQTTTTSPGEVAAFYHNAQRIQAASLHFSAALRAERVGMTVLATQEETLARAGLAGIFGSMDACACAHCRSAFGPAAYFIALLEALALHTSLQSYPSAHGLQILLGLRPDLLKVGLCCANADTPVPYLDLVNEVLEAAVAPACATFRDVNDPTPGGACDPAGVAEAERSAHPIVPEMPTDTAPVLTHGTGPERRAAPEITWYPTYRGMAYGNSRRYPFNLPFEQPREEVRIYLKHLGVEPGALQRVFASPDVPHHPESDGRGAELLAERLGLMRGDVELLTEPPLPEIVAFAAMGEPGPVDTNPLNQVGVLLERAGVSLEELQNLQGSEFLATRFAAPTFPAVLPCRLDELFLFHESDPKRLLDNAAKRGPFLDGLQRMLRLRARTGWTLTEVDRILSAVIDRTLVTVGLTPRELELAAMVDAVARRLRRSRVEALTLWGHLDARPRFDGTRSVFAALFLDPEVRSPVEPSFVKLAADTESVSPAAHKGLLAAALRCTGTDIDAACLPTSAEVAVDRTGLAFIVGRIFLARALDVPVSELHGAADVLVARAAAPLAGETGGPAETLRFIDAIDTMRRAGFSVADARDLVYGDRGAGSTVTPDARAFEALAEEFRTAVRGVVEDRVEAPAAIPLPTTIEAEGAQDVALKAELSVFLSADAATELYLQIKTPTSEGSPERAAFHASARQRLAIAMAPMEIERLVMALDAEPSTTVRVHHALVALAHGAALPLDRGAKRVVEALTAILTPEATDAVAELIAHGAVPAAPPALPPSLADIAGRPGVSELFAACGLSTEHAALFVTIDVPATLALREARRPSLVLAATLRARFRAMGRRVVTDKLAAALSADPATVEALVFRSTFVGPEVFVRLPNDLSHLPAGEAWIDPRLADADPDPTVKGRALGALARIMRAVAITRRAFVPAVALGGYELGAAAGGWLSLRTLPTNVPADDAVPQAVVRDPARAAAFEETLALAALVRRATALRGRIFDLFALFTQASPTDDLSPEQLYNVYGSATKFLRAVLGVSEAMVKPLLPQAPMAGRVSEPVAVFHGGPAEPPMNNVPIPGMRFATRSAITRGMHRLLDALDAVKRLGVTTDDALRWALAPIRANSEARRFTARMRAAAAIRGFVRAKYDEVRWREVAKPLTDALRLRQRDALCAWLIEHLRGTGRPDIRTRDDLYGHLLLDVEMGPEMMTSRLLQAIGSAQLFIQRALMNLETRADRKLTVGPLFASRWKWQKRYRLWEANRKVFYFPENWIEPELRQDKTPFFKELEEDLLQGDVTDERAEKAVRRYLEKLDAVARLDVRAFYRQAAADGAPEVLHVFGRTMGNPGVYYHRTRVNGSTWTPWVKLDIAIQGDHLLPAMMNRRLYLIWPEFTEKAGAAQSFDTNARTTPPPAPKQYAFRMAWSRLEGDVWTPKKVSRVETPITAEGQDPSSIFFRIKEGAGVQVACLSGPIAQTRATDADLMFSACDDDFVRESPPPGAMDFARGPSLGHVTRGQHVELATVGNAIVRHQINTARFRDGSTRMLTALRRVSRYEDAITLLPTHTAGGFVADRETFFWRDLARSFVVDPVRRPAPRRQIETFSVEGEFARGGYYACLNAPASSNTAIAQIDTPSAVVSQRNGTPVVTFSQLGAGAEQVLHLPKGDDNASAPSPSTGPSALLTVAYMPGLRSESGGLLRVSGLYHPRVCSFVEALERRGFDGLFALSTQFGRNAFDFRATYEPNDDAIYHERRTVGAVTTFGAYPTERVAFDVGDAYAQYNWELFFHVPFLVACQLNQAQRFDEAQRWFHYIFNPTLAVDDATVDAEAPSAAQGRSARYWRFAPFRRAEQGLRADEMASLMAADPATLTPTQRALRETFLQQLETLQERPFDPHAVAATRPRAYQLAVAMKYIDNLLDWGDNLFRQDTMESVQESVQVYLLAASILGARPKVMPERTPVTLSYGELAAGGATPKSDGAARFEQAVNTVDTCWHPRADEETGVETLGFSPYFCVPINDQLLGYWDRVADRLFKIRNSLNIDGVKRSLALYEPPIDPAVLVRARAAGVDLSGITEGAVGGAHYRFLPMLQRAADFTGDVRSLGGQLLAALEKRDAEALSNLRATHERTMTERLKAVREHQYAEAQQSRESLDASRKLAVSRRDYYTGLSYMNAGEITAMALQAASTIVGAIGQGLSLVGSGAALFPDGIVGFVGPAPTGLMVTFGGTKIQQSTTSGASALNFAASLLQQGSSMAGTFASYERRQDEWDQQARQAAIEIEQIDKQIAAADLRVAIAQKELDNHAQQIENAREVEEFLQDKFTNEALYDWQVRQVSTLYFQSYRLAYDLARKAENAYRFERLAPAARFVQFGHWDNLKRGLLAGERLHLDLRRMEHAYIEQNRRDLELSKHVSLAATNPLALLALRRDGRCTIELPESLFDRDYPGHYMRRIKAVSVTIPAVVGPYAGVHATLTLARSVVRTSTNTSNNYRPDPVGAIDNDPRFTIQRGAVQSICTSSGQNDSGVFQLDFRDERYLPFEGAGAESTWDLQLRQGDNDFDLAALTDVILHVQYTARDGGEALREAAMEARIEGVDGDARDTREEFRVFSAKQHFPTAWQAFTAGLTDTTAERVLSLDDLSARLPTAPQGGDVVVRGVALVAARSDRAVTPTASVDLRRGEGASPTVIVSTPTASDLSEAVALPPITALHHTDGVWSLRLYNGATSPRLDALTDIVIVVKTERRVQIG